MDLWFEQKSLQMSGNDFSHASGLNAIGGLVECDIGDCGVEVIYPQRNVYWIDLSMSLILLKLCFLFISNKTFLCVLKLKSLY